MLGSLAVHAAMFYGFKPRTFATAVAAQSPSPTCVLVSPLDASRNWERELYAWCFLADPTVLSLPDERFGFSDLRRGERILPLTAVSAYAEPAIPIVTDAFPEFAPVIPFEPFATAAGAKTTAPPVAIPEPEAVVALPTAILWRQADGTGMTPPPGWDPDAARAVLRGEPLPSTVTCLEIDREPPFDRRLECARVRIVQSSGNVAADLLAVRSVQTSLFQAERARDADDDPEPAAPWLPHPGQRQRVEVEWRLAASPEEP